MNGILGYALGAAICWLLFRLIAAWDDRRKKGGGHYGPGPWHF